MIIEIQDDILNTDCVLIAHGVNCQGVMGSGVAKVLIDEFPNLHHAYTTFCEKKLMSGWEISDLLGLVYTCEGGKDNKLIANCFTQQTYGNNGQVHLNYDALRHCVSSIVGMMHSLNIKALAIPKIGCGLAGGDWNKVKEIFEVYFNETSDLTLKVYSL